MHEMYSFTMAPRIESMEVERLNQRVLETERKIMELHKER